MSAEQAGALLGQLVGAARGRVCTATSWRTTTSATFNSTAHWTHDPASKAEKTFTLAGERTAGAVARHPPAAAGRLSLHRRTDGAMGHANSAAGGQRAPRQDGRVVQGGDSLQGWRELSRQGHLGDGCHAAASTTTHWSAAKATTLKPTVVYSARQHANEVSSTSHTLPAGRTAAHRSRVPEEAEGGERRRSIRSRTRMAPSWRTTCTRSRPTTCCTPAISARSAWTWRPSSGSGTRSIPSRPSGRRSGARGCRTSS